MKPPCSVNSHHLPVLLAVLFALLPSAAPAWGPHQTITKIALDALPERAQWEARLGTTNFNALTNYCLLPDQKGRDLGAFYADDYLLIRAMPLYVGHTMPGAQKAFEPYFRRALLALRTETPENACRQMGPLVHFVEDVGAPPHAKEKCPHHSELENWVKAEEIAIPGYRPRLLGNTDEEALAGLLRRIEALVAFSAERAERALPLVEGTLPDRAKVEPIILESALESTRVTADLLHTVFTLGLAKQPVGAGLAGNVTAAELPGRNLHGARVVLLDTDYATLATGPAVQGAWSGGYEFHNLPPGRYRVLAYRTGSEFKVGPAIELVAGRETRVDFELKATDPPGNLIENPDGKLSYLEAGAPDRWKLANGIWTSAPITVKPGERYRCGAIVKDASARVHFVFASKPPSKGKPPEPQRVALEMGSTQRAETLATAEPQRITVTAVVDSGKPLTEVLERVWVMPEAGATR